MPKGYGGSGAGVAAGIAGAADSFVKSFYQARHMKVQEHMAESEPALRAMMTVLSDPNIAYETKADILDTIPKVMGVKMDVPFSEQTGFRRLLRNKVLTDEGQSGIAEKPAKEGTKQTDIEDPNAGNVMLPTTGGGQTQVRSPMATSVQMKPTRGTEAVPGREYIAPTSTEMGKLSPVEYQSIIAERAQQRGEESKYSRDIAMLNANIDAQTRSLKALGFTKEVFRGFDQSGNYNVVMANAAGETKTIPLGKQDPEKIRIAQVRGMGHPSAALQNQMNYYLYGIDPTSGDRPINPSTGTYYTQQEASGAALSDVNKAFNLTNEARTSLIESTKQRNTGTTPLSPAQSADDVARDKAREDTFTKTLDEAKAAALASHTEVGNYGVKGIADSGLSLLKQQAADQVAQFDKELKDIQRRKVDTTDPEYVRAENQLNAATTRYRDLEVKFNEANAKDVANKQRVADAEARLANHLSGITQGAAKSGGKYPQAIMDMISTVRNNPKNKTKVANMTDDEIVAELARQGKIKK